MIQVLGNQRTASLVLASMVLLITANMALSDVTIVGHVQVFNPISEDYVPLENARVRIILGEYFDYDTFDVETRTDSSGDYSVSKGNAWFAGGYSAKLVVVTQSDLATVHGMVPTDGYQAFSAPAFAPNEDTIARNLSIGGPDENVAEYRVGGIISIADVGSIVTNTEGRRAFFIYHEIMDHYERLIDRAPQTSDFNHKGVGFPAPETEGASYYFPIVDDLRIASGNVTGPAEWASGAARHELSHGMMADLYPLSWPSVSHFAHGHSPFASHDLETEWDHRGFALQEAWAEFLDEVTYDDSYNELRQDLEVENEDWPEDIEAGADHSRIEGEIAGVLWDIYDAADWELRMNQVDEIPGDEMFLDGIADPELEKIWQIFKGKRPDTLTHGEVHDPGDPERSFVWYWLNETDFGQEHELKAILFNRGIVFEEELPQNPPSVTIEDVSWLLSQFYWIGTLTLTITVEEEDPEDQEHTYADLFINGTQVGRRYLTSGWVDGKNTLTLSVARSLPEKETLEVCVAVHDDMESDFECIEVEPPEGQLVLDPPPSYIEIVAMVYRFVVQRAPIGPGIINPRIQLLGLPTKDTNIPLGSSPLQPTEVDGELISEVREVVGRPIYEGLLPDTFSLLFSVDGQFDDEVFKGDVKHTLSVKESQFGTYTARIPIDGAPGVTAEIVYAVRPQEMKLDVRDYAELLPPVSRIKILKPFTFEPVVTSNELTASAKQLTEDYRNLQADVLSMAETLEWRLSPELVASLADGSLTVEEAAKVPRLVTSALVTDAELLDLPATSFLDGAIKGEGLVDQLPLAAQHDLERVQKETTQQQDLLRQIPQQAEQLIVELKEIAQQQTKAGIDPSHFEKLAHQLDHIPPSVEGYRQLLVNVQQVSADALKLVTVDAGPADELSYKVELDAGINFLSVPLDPGKPWRLSDLAAQLGRSLNFIVWYDSQAQGFATYFPDFPSDSPANKPVAGAEGYLIVMGSPTTVTFRGTGWDNTKNAAPAASGPQVLVIDGQVLQGLSDQVQDGVRVVVRNERTGAVVEGPSGMWGIPGQFMVTYATFGGERIVQEGDALSLSLFDVTGQALMEPFIYRVTSAALQNHRVTLPPFHTRLIPEETALLSNYPNPFNPETWIPYQLATRAQVRVEIYDAIGRPVRVLELGEKPAGHYLNPGQAVYWDGTNQIGEPVGSGIYFYRLQAGDFAATRKMVVAK